MANFGMGDTILCINSLDVCGNTGLLAGKSYKVTDITGCCGIVLVRVAGIRYGKGACMRCRKVQTRAHFVWRFIKPDSQLEESAQQLEKEVAHG